MNISAGVNTPLIDSLKEVYRNQQCEICDEPGAKIYRVHSGDSFLNEPHSACFLSVKEIEQALRATIISLFPSSEASHRQNAYDVAITAIKNGSDDKRSILDRSIRSDDAKKLTTIYNTIGIPAAIKYFKGVMIDP